LSTSTLPSHAVSAPAPERAPDVAPTWKNEVSERLRAHRTRRPRMAENQPALPGMEPAPSSTIAARVAERYSRVPSYREMLAAQAAARAAAEAAALAAAEAVAKAAAQVAVQAVAEAAARAALESHSRELLWDERSPSEAESPVAYPAPAPESRPWQPELIRYSVSSDSLPAPRSTPAEARVPVRSQNDAFLPAGGILDPFQEALVEPASPLPARVIEFPRELIAPRKARPRLAEGPLREESTASQDPAASSQRSDQLASASDGLFSGSSLRIFEAEPDTAEGAVSAARSDGERSPQSVQEWHSIQLDAEGPLPQSKSGSSTSVRDGIHLHVASLEGRAMAGVVDVALTLAAFLVFVLVFAVCTTHFPAGRVAAVGAAITLLAMWILYQFVFFGLSDATPGMRYAKIALCTFDDENPTRKAMRGRIGAQMLSALPLGLGFLWALFDEDSLGWHDRITQTYQRSYRDL